MEKLETNSYIVDTGPKHPVLVLAMVDMKAVDSTEESQQLWLRVDGSLEESRQLLWV